MRKTFLGITVLLLAACFATVPALAMPSYNDVLLVVNAQSAESQAIGAYFKTARNIPDANVCTISVAAGVDGARMSVTERNTAVSTIKNHLIKNALTDKINYIVLTRGIPYWAYTGVPPADYQDPDFKNYQLFDLYLMYALSDASIDPKLDNVFYNNPYYYYNNTLSQKTTLYADSTSSPPYIDIVNDGSLVINIGDMITITGGMTASKIIAAIDNYPGYSRITFDSKATYALFFVKNAKITIAGQNAPKLTKKFTKTRFGYYIVSRMDGLGTITIKSMIDNTGAPAYESYKKPVDGKMKLLTITPYFDRSTSDEINSRGNIKVVSPNPQPLDTWDPESRKTTLGSADIAFNEQVKVPFEDVAKDTMFCFLNNVGSGYYSNMDFMRGYPFIYRGATFLPGSIMTVYRSYPAQNMSHGSTGGPRKINLSTKVQTVYAKLDASDMKFRDMGCAAYDLTNKQLWCGTGTSQLDISFNLSAIASDDVQRTAMLNYGGGIAIYDKDGNILQYLNANDSGSPLKNNRVVKMVYDKNSKYMWVAHYKGIQYYDLIAKTWNDIPELQCSYAAACDIYPDPFDSDKVYFSFYHDSSLSTNAKVSSQLPGAKTKIFEYSKKLKNVTAYEIDASSKGLNYPRLAKTSANTLWVGAGSLLYRYDLAAKSVLEKIDLNTLVPEKLTLPDKATSAALEPVRHVISPSAGVVFAVAGCNIKYSVDMDSALADSQYQRKNYVVHVTENTPSSTVELINTAAMNKIDTTFMPDVKDIAADPNSNGKTLYMLLASDVYNSQSILRSADGAGKVWTAFSTDYGTLNQGTGITLDASGNMYVVRAYDMSQNIAADFQAFGVCAWGGGMTHDGMNYYPGQKLLSTSAAGKPYATDINSWNYDNDGDSGSALRGHSQTEPMMLMMLDGFYTGEARFAVFLGYPFTGGGGHIGHMLTFEPKCAPFAPRVNEPLIPANPQVKDKQIIEIPIISPGLPWHMNDWIMSTFNKDTVQITDETGTVFTPAKYEFIKPSGPDPDDKDTGKKYITGTGKLVITGNYTGVLYKVKLICGINGLKNIKGASLTNTRPNEFKDEITLNFGNGMDISKGVYISPDEISGPVKMPQNNSKVDLVVSSIALSPAPPVAGKPLTVKFQIKNIGTVKTSTGTITAGVYWNNILIGSVTHGDLAAGASTAVLSVTLNAQYVTAGNKNTVMAVADSTNIVIEMRETNNTNSATFLIDNRPDLKVTAITLSSTKPGKTTVNFKIANTGFGPTAAGTGTQTASVYVNNNLAGTVNYNDLAKGAVVSLQLANVTVTAGTCKVKVVADSAGIVPEVSKTNNSLEKPFSIK